jgi:hypothetical protein
MKRTILGLLGVAVAATAGCWHEMGESYLDSHYVNEGIVNIAVLPIVNKTEQPMAAPAVLEALVRQLGREKKYNVLPTAKVMARLRVGAGGAAYAQLMNKISAGEEVPIELYSQMGRELDADAVFEETVVSYHHLREDVIGPTSSGVAAYQQVPVTIVEVKGSLWGTHAGVVLWRDHASQRYYHDVASEGEGSATPVVEQATHLLLANFPENRWQPQTIPTSRPVPAPVTTYSPIFNTPSDPNAPN